MRVASREAQTMASWACAVEAFCSSTTDVGALLEQHEVGDPGLLEAHRCRDAARTRSR